MKIKIRFEHSKKSKDYAFSPATYHFDHDCSTGPVITRGKYDEFEYDVKQGDTIYFATTKYSDEPVFMLLREGKVVNAPPDSPINKKAKKK